MSVQYVQIRDNIMKIELKNIKHYPKLSRETNAFSAYLYIDGILFATCTDDGNGGVTNFIAINRRENELIQAEIYAK